ncbi:MAG: D-glycero-beta-D-manno-heptose-7-phosphate kinase [Verrucomicrobia bacterium]|nr:D-glycero-beta-D-manno-heptose-7-phosphate kinase [Verrucomicrobiota bacterium]MCF7709444.1 D-glycero-beta-D-manno-heptose-7-phosphate kinase [Verrucomicrobiota bacterium]
MNHLSKRRVCELLENMRRTRIVVVGDIMLDRFIWGSVTRVSPEAPVPVVDYVRENTMPGGAANVARNLSDLGTQTSLFGVIGADEPAKETVRLLERYKIDCGSLVRLKTRPTSIKTRIIAHQQQVVRLDRESKTALNNKTIRSILNRMIPTLEKTDGVILCDYGKGVVTQHLLEELKSFCRPRGIWISLDPKPIHKLELRNVSLITPNRKEAFELAGIHDGQPDENPLEDKKLLEASDILLEKLNPALLLITLGEQGMLLRRRGEQPYHIPTMAREVYDVSGAGDTVIASFTLAIAAGASPAEAAIISNAAAGVVVGKVGTATATSDEISAYLTSSYE